MLKLIKGVIPVLALVGIPVSIAYIGMYDSLWALLFSFFCEFILFWWYLSNIVFRPTGKKDRRDLAYRRVMGNGRENSNC